MAQPNRGRRPRGRNNNQNRQKFINKNQAFDSSGPSGRVRGNAQQIFEKYQALARDAQAGGEHTLAEAHFQHAEHYLRLYNEMMVQIDAQRAEKAKRDEERAEREGEAKARDARDTADRKTSNPMRNPPPLSRKAILARPRSPASSPKPSPNRLKNYR